MADLADWGIEPNEEINEQLRQDLEEIAAAEREAWATAHLIFIGSRDA